MPVALQGASSRIREKRSPGCQSAASAAMVSASRCSRVSVWRTRLSRVSERSTAITRPPRAASCAVLPPGAAQRSATVSPSDKGSSPAGRVAASILNPPRAVRKAREILDLSARVTADDTVAKRRRIQPVRPERCLSGILQHDIERRLGEMRVGDLPRRLLAIVSRPGVPEPVRRVEPGGVLRLDQGRALAGDAAEHRVGEAAKRPLAHQADRLGEGGVRRCLEKQQLRHAEPERVAGDERLVRQRMLQAMGDDGIDLAETAQRGRDQQPGETEIRRRERLHARRGLQRLVQRLEASENAAEDVSGQATGGNTGKRGSTNHNSIYS